MLGVVRLMDLVLSHDILRVNGSVVDAMLELVESVIAEVDVVAT